MTASFIVIKLEYIIKWELFNAMSAVNQSSLPFVKRELIMVLMIYPSAIIQTLKAITWSQARKMYTGECKIKFNKT